MKSKLARFEQLKSFPNVLERTEYPDTEPFPYRGKWSEAFFKNGKPIVLELACGKGEYTVNLAQQFPDKNFIGIDIKGNRMWKGAKLALNEGIHNAAFLRIQIERLEHYFGKDEVQEIWITFPDPFLKPSKSKKRLTSSRFLGVYRQVLPKDGFVNLKTDSPQLYDFTKEVIAEEKLRVSVDDFDIYAKPITDEILKIKTFYEKMHLADGRKIKYIRFQP